MTERRLCTNYNATQASASRGHNVVLTSHRHAEMLPATIGLRGKQQLIIPIIRRPTLTLPRTPVQPAALVVSHVMIPRCLGRLGRRRRAFAGTAEENEFLLRQRFGKGVFLRMSPRTMSAALCLDDRRMPVECGTGGMGGTRGIPEMRSGMADTERASKRSRLTYLLEISRVICRAQSLRQSTKRKVDSARNGP